MTFRQLPYSGQVPFPGALRLWRLGQLLALQLDRQEFLAVRDDILGKAARTMAICSGSETDVPNRECLREDTVIPSPSHTELRHCPFLPIRQHVHPHYCYDLGKLFLPGAEDTLWVPSHWMITYCQGPTGCQVTLQFNIRVPLIQSPMCCVFFPHHPEWHQ